MSDTLTIEVLAGMANRIRAMVSAICLAADLDMKLRVIWSANHTSCMARFDMLFDVKALPDWVTVDMGPRPEHSVEILSPQDLELYLQSGSRQPIRSYGHFYQKDPKKWFSYLCCFKPLQELPFQIPEGAVGVHIRRGDHQKARQFSPIHLFIEEMKKEPETTVFVVATDDRNERNALLEHFHASRLLFPANTLSRFTLKGMQDALLDFVALSKCDKILASYNSSFSELAAIYGCKPIHVVKTT